MGSSEYLQEDSGPDTGVQRGNPQSGDADKEAMHEWGMLFTFEELMLLLQSMGVEEVRGILPDVEPVSDEEVIQIMYGLVQKGVLTAGEDAFMPDPVTGRMLRCMGRPDCSYLTENHGENVYCYEKDGDLLITRLSPLKPRAVELTLRSAGE